MSKSRLMMAISNYEIAQEDLDLFDCSFENLERFFVGFNHPLNVYQQYLYGLMLVMQADGDRLSKFIESIYHEEITLLLKGHLSLIRSTYKIMDRCTWNSIKKRPLDHPILDAECLELQAKKLFQIGEWEESLKMFENAAKSFKKLGLNRRSLNCRYEVCQLTRKLDPNYDSHGVWAVIMLEAKRLGDRKLYMTALSKLSFSL